MREGARDLTRPSCLIAATDNFDDVAGHPEIGALRLTMMRLGIYALWISPGILGELAGARYRRASRRLQVKLSAALSQSLERRKNVGYS